VIPTSFRYNQDHDAIDIGGHDFATRTDVVHGPIRSMTIRSDGRPSV